MHTRIASLMAEKRFIRACVGACADELQLRRVKNRANVLETRDMVRTGRKKLFPKTDFAFNFRF